ncbi:MAG: hypothetical protein JWL61_3856 [Gemmatimonadetes bacterium]|nr:hypothetical protein [Gemmatimonadota bacterium]
MVRSKRSRGSLMKRATSGADAPVEARRSYLGSRSVDSAAAAHHPGRPQVIDLRASSDWRGASCRHSATPTRFLDARPNQPPALPTVRSRTSAAASTRRECMESEMRCSCATPPASSWLGCNSSADRPIESVSCLKPRERRSVPDDAALPWARRLYRSACQGQFATRSTS